MSPLTLFFINLAISVAAYVLAPKPKGPDPGTIEDLNLPTVSQSRKVPLVVGLARVKSPNILNAGGYRTESIKDGGNLFSSGVVVGYKRYLSVAAAIAWGEGELHKIFIGDYLLWDKTADNGGNALTAYSRFYINKPNLFGTGKQDGGCAGWVRFYPGTASQMPDSYFETEIADTQNPQPGYRHLSYLVFEDFYFGNTMTFRPISLDYAYYPNPFNASDSKIGADANPAYVHHAILKDKRFGADISTDIDVSSFNDAAAVYASEGLGFSRAFFDGSGSDLEQEIMQHCDSVRYANATTGQLTIAPARENYDPATIPSITYLDLVDEAYFVETNITASATDIWLTYTDRAESKPKKIHLSNAANRAAIGRTNAVDLDFPAISNASTAAKVIDREALRSFGTATTGKMVINRIAAGWNQGDVFSYSDSRMGIQDLMLRVVAIQRGTLTSGEITIDFVQDKYTSGQPIFDVPNFTNPESYISSAEDVTDYRFLELPQALSSNVGALSILAARPNLQANDFQPVATINGAANYLPTTDFRERFLLHSPCDSSESSTFVLSGNLGAPEFGFDTSKNTFDNLMLIAGAAGEEFIHFQSATYNSANNTTTLNNVKRGLLDTVPKSFTSSDVVWVLPAFAILNNLYSAQALSLKMLVANPNSVLSESDATSRAYQLTSRSLRPFCPSFHSVSASTGTVVVNWRERNHTSDVLEHFYSPNSNAAAGVTYTAKFYNDDTNSLIDSQVGISGETATFSDTGSSYTLRIELSAQIAGLNSRDTYTHFLSFSG